MQNFQGRNKKVFVKSIVYGSCAKFLATPIPVAGQQDPLTHSWNVFLRPYNHNETMNYISKVVFKLHETCNPPEVTRTSQPFEVQQMGWGEFTIVIEIHFKDPRVDTVSLYHNLRLYHDDTNKNIERREPIVHEQYDDLVFKNPRPEFIRILERGEKRRNFSRSLTRLQCYNEITRFGSSFVEKEREFVQNSRKFLGFVNNEIQNM